MKTAVIGERQTEGIVYNRATTSLSPNQSHADGR
jgi:hypothetical protein